MLLLCALAALVLLVSAVAHTQGQGDIEHLTLDDVSDETIGLAPAKPAPPPENARPAEPSKPVEPNSPVTPVETTPAAEPDWLTETTQPMASPAAQLSPDTTDAPPPAPRRPSRPARRRARHTRPPRPPRPPNRPPGP